MTDQTDATPSGTVTGGAQGTEAYLATSVADIPSTNLALLALQGYRHKLGNEVAAKVAAWKKTDDGKAASDDEVATFARNARAEMLDKIVNGVLGVRAAGAPRVSGIDALKRAIAIEFLKARLKAYSDKTGTKVALPTGENTVNVAGKDMTREDMIAAEMRRSEAKIAEEAERRQKAQSEGADVGEDLFGE